MKINITKEMVKDVSRLKDAYKIFTGNGSPTTNWQDKSKPRFEVDLGGIYNIERIDVRDEHGQMSGDSYFIGYAQVDGKWKELFRDQLKDYMVNKSFVVSTETDRLMFEGELVPAKIEVYGKQSGREAVKITPDMTVTFSGAECIIDENGGFSIKLDSKPKVFSIENNIVDLPPTIEPEPPVDIENKLEANKLLAFKKPVKNANGSSILTGYLLYLPKDYYTSKKKYPLVIKFHGDGERGAVMSLEQMGTKIDPEKSISRGESKEFILICPQNLYTWTADNVRYADAMIEEAIKDLRVDRNRIYVTGLSKGGAATWDYTVLFPDKVAASVPICGWCTVMDQICNAKDVPVWTFHNSGDKTVGVGGTINAVNKLKGCGSKSVDMTIYNRDGHDAWTATYNNKDMWDWMFKQNK